MKKLLALLLALTMVFAVTACGNDNGNGGSGNGNITGGTENLTEDDIAGDWEMIIEVSDLIDTISENADAFKNNESFKMFQMMGDFNTDAKIVVDISFEEDGEAIVVMDPDRFMDFFEDFFDDYFTYLENGGLEKMAEAAGQDMDALLDQLEEQGMSFDDYLDQMRKVLDSNMDSMRDSMAQTMKDSEGTWEFEGNTIKFIDEESEDSTDFKILGYNGNKMSCTISASSDDVEIDINVTLKRK